MDGKGGSGELRKNDGAFIHINNILIGIKNEFQLKYDNKFHIKTRIN